MCLICLLRTCTNISKRLFISLRVLKALEIFQFIGKYYKKRLQFHLFPFYSFAGVSRSSSCVIAYLMQEHGLGMFDAMSFVRRKRPIIFPNPGFQRQLLDFEKYLKSVKQKPVEKMQIDTTPIKKFHKNVERSNQNKSAKTEHFSESINMIRNSSDGL